MGDWLERLNELLNAAPADVDAVTSFAWLHAGFDRVHPFAEGNGRMARLVANLPALRAGHPPVLIPLARRAEYIELLARWQLAAGRPKAGGSLVCDSTDYEAFVAFCRAVTREVDELILETRRCQDARRCEA